MKILICTGIYPPHLGGPAQYAVGLEQAFRRRGDSVSVLTYGVERKIPVFFRHVLFFFRTLVTLRGVDMTIALDTFSVGVPSAWACRLLGKKIIVRVGGDFIWEQYVERMREPVLLREFYIPAHMSRFSLKERIIFFLTRQMFSMVDAIVFSTAWQRDIFRAPYRLDMRKVSIIENFYGPKIEYRPVQNERKVFVATARRLFLKNHDMLKQAIEMARAVDPSIDVDFSNVPHENFLKKIQESYAVILVSFGDISPNMILDAIRCNKPFVLTKENGLTDRIGDTALYVDPCSVSDITEKILALSSPEVYEKQLHALQQFSFVHTWDDIAHEFIKLHMPHASSL